VTSDLDKALTLCDDILKRIRVARQNRPGQRLVESMGDDLVGLIRRYGEPYDFNDLLAYYQFVRLYIMDLALGFYDQVALAGPDSAIKGWDRQRWRTLYNELQGILSTETGDPVIFHEEPSFALSRTVEAEWRASQKHQVPPAYLFNTYLDLAVASIIIREGPPGKEACLEARYGWAKARQLLPAILGSSSDSDYLGAKANAERWIEQIEFQIAALCSR